MKPKVLRVFVSHSRKDSKTKEAVRNGLEKAGLEPVYYGEQTVTRKIATVGINNRIRNAIGFFVFVTKNSIGPITRDWICFEMGLATAHEQPIYSWKARKVPYKREPTFLRLLGNPSEYSTTTPEGIAKLESQVMLAGKQLVSLH